MPAVLSRRGRKVAALLSVAVGALAVGGATSAQAAPIPCAWYDCVPMEFDSSLIKRPVPPECRCPDALELYSELAIQPALELARFDVASRFAVPGLVLGADRFGAGVTP